MVDVLLTHSNHLFNDRKQVEKMQPYPPLQPLIAAAYLRSASVTVAFCDVTFDSPEQAILNALRTYAPRLVVVCEDDFNFLSKMCLSRNRELAFWIAQEAKAAGIATAVHGSDSSDHVAAYLDAGFDYVLLGEVEETLREIAEGTPQSAVAGIAYRSAETAQITYTSPRPLNGNLNRLPRPALDLISVDQYRAAWKAAHGYFSLNLISSRGCPFHCNWCAKPIYGDRYHSRSAWLTAEDMLYLKQSFQPDHIWFADDIFALSNAWTSEFAAAVKSLDAHIPFKMQSRCDLMIRNTVSALKTAGCCEVWMGAESGSQRILNAMDKGLEVEQIYRARQHLASYSIRACFFLQFGYPGEDWQDILATIQMVRETKPDDIGVSVSYPLPGTKFFQLVASQMGDKANWSESGELAMMFRGTYSTTFYRALADAIRLEVRGDSGVDHLQAAWDKVHELKGGHALQESLQ